LREWSDAVTAREQLEPQELEEARKKLKEYLYLVDHRL
jgi:hypothetical protein